MEDINKRSRPAATEEDGSDQIGLDSPRSGVATPQPDLHDKRLPGIMSYFNQVRSQSSFSRFLPFKANEQTTAASEAVAPQTEEPPRASLTPRLPLSAVEQETHSVSGDEGSLLAHEALGSVADGTPPADDQMHPYPTPPTSQRSSVRNFKGDAGSEKLRDATPPPSSRPASLHQMNVPDGGRGIGVARRSSLLAPLTATVDGSSVPAPHLSNPASPAPNVPNSTSWLRGSSGEPEDLSYSSPSVAHLTKLTDVTATKSGASTPTRALSTTQPSQSEEKQSKETSRTNSEGSTERETRTASQTPTPSTSSGGAPASRGKLTIKVGEARGLRRCRDPYVVVVFQRSELISPGPRRAAENDDDAAIAAVQTGGIPIQRQSSDSGRPMAIPMRSRQSSNTSLTDFNTFRRRNSSQSRRSFTNPTWDAEAVL